MSKNTEKDIILLCKKRYDSNKYPTLLDAFEAYYYKRYGCDDIQMDYKFAVNLFLKPSVKFLLTENRIRSFIDSGLFNESFHERYACDANGCTDFYEVLYHRLTTWVCLQKVREQNAETGEYEWLIDLSDYANDENII